MKRKLVLLSIIYLYTSRAFSQTTFNGPEMNLGNLSRLLSAKTRSISPENFTGEKGKAGMARIVDKEIPNAANASSSARDLGDGWKVNPYVRIKPGETFTMAEINENQAKYQIYEKTNNLLLRSMLCSQQCIQCIKSTGN